MKVRSGFVSNSSSSSFLIFVGDKERRWKLQLGSSSYSLDVDDLESIVDRPSYYSDDNRFSWISAAEARDYVDHLWIEDDEKKALIAQIDRLATDIDERDNYYFARVEYSHHDRIIGHILHAMIDECIIDKIFELEG